jgi:hypothetical protein
MKKTPNEFWLTLHRLAGAYEAEGETPEVRAENIGNELCRFPRLVQRVSLDEMKRLGVNLLDLYPMMNGRVKGENGDHSLKCGGSA